MQTKQTPILNTPDESVISPPAEFVPLRSYPDAATLAHLVAQRRFASLPNAEAIKAALSLLHECQGAIDDDLRSAETLEQITKEYQHLTAGPDSFPAVLDDFLDFMVQGKSRLVSQHRYFQFLEHQFAEIKSSEHPELIDAATSVEWANERLEHFKKYGFTQGEWYLTAMAYQQWWKQRCHEDKRRAGLARTQKHRARKKKQQT